MSKDSTLGTFIMMMEQFISEMISSFPKESKLKVYSNSFDLMKKTNPRKILQLFMDSVAPYTQSIIYRDESVMLDDTIPLNRELNLKNIWQSPDITDSTKEAIWSHMNTLLMFGTTLQNIPSELMSGIEQLASQYSSQMGDSANNIDPNLLMSGLQSMMSHMGKQ
jgi:hypothetical protein